VGKAISTSVAHCYNKSTDGRRRRLGRIRGDAIGGQVVDWQHAVDRKWDSLSFGGLRVETNTDHHVFEVEIFLNDLNRNTVRAELYGDGIDGNDPVRQEMECARSLPDGSRRCVYHVTVPAARPAKNYTPRVTPHYDGVAVPLEDARILWQR
jgi:starch phosphorylase